MPDYLRYTDEATGRRLFIVDFNGEDNAAGVVTELVHESQWFELIPLPDNMWEIRVKEENEALLTKLVHKYYYGVDHA